MRYLLDTQVALWLLSDDKNLGHHARGGLEAAEIMYVSAASIWEAQIKAGIGKLKRPADLVAAVAATGFRELPVDWEVAAAVDEIKLPHRDPFDRLLLVQAMQQQVLLVTADEVLLKAYPRLCVDARV